MHTVTNEFKNPIPVEVIIMLISSLLDANVVNVNIEAFEKRDVLELLVNLAEDAGMVNDRRAVLDSLIERESMCSTAIGKGVAIPHPCDGLPGAVDGVALSAISLDRGMELDAPDDLPVQLFFLVGAEDRRHHLHILGKLARLLREQDLREGLLSARTPEAFVECIRQAEHAMNTNTR